jgi:hypothetical protein
MGFAASPREFWRCPLPQKALLSRAVAQQLGVSRSWASREANAPGTRNLIAELLELRRERTYEVDKWIGPGLKEASSV